MEVALGLLKLWLSFNPKSSLEQSQGIQTFFTKPVPSAMKISI